MSTTIYFRIMSCFVLSVDVMGSFEDSTIYHLQSPSSETEPTVIPDIPDSYFASQTTLDSSHRLQSRPKSYLFYIFPISREDSSKEATITALQYCYRQTTTIPQDTPKMLFSILSLQRLKLGLIVTSQATIFSQGSSENCINKPLTIHRICCTYQSISLQEADSGLTFSLQYFGIGIAAANPNLLRFPVSYEEYRTPFYKLPARTPLARGDTFNVTKLAMLTGQAPMLRLYLGYQIPTEDPAATSYYEVTPSSHLGATSTAAKLQNDNATSSSPRGPSGSNLRQILLPVFLVAGCALSVPLTIAIIVVLFKLKKVLVKYRVSSSPNYYSVDPLVTLDATSVDHEDRESWLPAVRPRSQHNGLQVEQTDYEMLTHYSSYN